MAAIAQVSTGRIGTGGTNDMGNYTYTDGSFEMSPRLPDAYAEALRTELREATEGSESGWARYGPWWVEQTPLWSAVAPMDSTISGWWPEDETNPWGAQLQDLVDRIAVENPGITFDGAIDWNADEYAAGGTFVIDGTEVRVEHSGSFAGWSQSVRKPERKNAEEEPLRTHDVTREAAEKAWNQKAGC